jgi:hypothetical protein
MFRYTLGSHAIVHLAVQRKYGGQGANHPRSFMSCSSLTNRRSVRQRRGPISEALEIFRCSGIHRAVKAAFRVGRAKNRRKLSDLQSSPPLSPVVEKLRGSLCRGHHRTAIARKATAAIIKNGRDRQVGRSIAEPCRSTSFCLCGFFFPASRRRICFERMDKAVRDSRNFLDRGLERGFVCL